MDNNTIKFSCGEAAKATFFGDKAARELVDISVDWTKAELQKMRAQDSGLLISQYAVDYDKWITNEVKQAFVNKLYTYCSNKAGMSNFDHNNKEHLVLAFSNPMFEWHLMSIITQTINTVNADNEMEDIMLVANVVNVGMGDSLTQEIESKALYNVQKHSYGNNKSRYQAHLKSPITIKPEPNSASVTFDVIQMTAINFDWGKQVAKIASSFRTQLYQDVVSVIFTTSNVSGTPFYKDTFAKSTYSGMADQLEAANSSPVTAYGTRTAFVSMSDSVDTGYTTLDEINKTGFIANLYGVRTQVLKQAVDSNTSSLTVRVPTNKVLLLSSTGDRPAKVAKESNLQVKAEDGLNTALYRRVYTMIDSWKVALATQAAYGIQMV